MLEDASFSSTFPALDTMDFHRFLFSSREMPQHGGPDDHNAVVGQKHNISLIIAALK